MTGKPLPPPRMTMPAQRDSHTFVGVGPDANRPRPQPPRVDLPKTVAHVNNSASLLRTVGAIVAAVVVTIAGVSVWGASRPSQAYVDERLRVVAAAAASVDHDLEARQSAVDVRIERLVTISENQQKTIADHEARLRECESRRTDTVTARAR